MILTSFEDIDVLKHFKYLALAVINHIWNEWQLDKPFITNSEAEVELCKIAKILTMNRCTEPISKSCVVDWFQTTWLSNLLDVSSDKINASRIFRDLDRIENCKEQVCKHLYETLKKRNPKNSRDEKATKNKFIKQLSKLKLKKIIDISLVEVEINSYDTNGNEKIIKTFKAIVNPLIKSKLDEAGKLDGFWLLVTNHFEKTNNEYIISPEYAIKPY